MEQKSLSNENQETGVQPDNLQKILETVDLFGDNFDTIVYRTDGSPGLCCSFFNTQNNHLSQCLPVSAGDLNVLNEEYGFTVIEINELIERQIEKHQINEIRFFYEIEGDEVYLVLYHINGHGHEFGMGMYELNENDFNALRNNYSSSINFKEVEFYGGKIKNGTSENIQKIFSRGQPLTNNVIEL